MGGRGVRDLRRRRGSAATTSRRRPAARSGSRATGDAAQTGTGVGCAGDVNGDGIDDLLVGAWALRVRGRAPATARAARAYVVFGARDLRRAGPLDLGLLGDARLPDRRAGRARVRPPRLRGRRASATSTATGATTSRCMANTADTTDATPAAHQQRHRLRAARAGGHAATSTSAPDAIAAHRRRSPARPRAVRPDDRRRGVGDVNGDGAATSGSAPTPRVRSGARPPPAPPSWSAARRAAASTSPTRRARCSPSAARSPAIGSASASTARATSTATASATS